MMKETLPLILLTLLLLQAQEGFCQETQHGRIDTIKNFQSETARLVMTSSRESMYAGECTMIELSFQVRYDNRLRIQFFDLGQQLYKILSIDLNLPDTYVVNQGIDEIVGVDKIINDTLYTSYTIYRAFYCPSKASGLEFPPVTLKMSILARIGMVVSRYVEFRSAPVTIEVKPIPDNGFATDVEYSMVGTFSVEGHYSESKIVAGLPFTYKLRVHGEGLLFPLEPLIPKSPGLRADLLAIQGVDTIISDRLQSEKIFVYRLIPLQEGVYDLGRLFTFTFYDPSSKKVKEISPLLKFRASRMTNDLAQADRRESPFYSKKGFIAIDASMSMLIEDYPPNRLSVVKQGVQQFMQDRPDCGIGIITFAGDARHLPSGDSSACYGAQVAAIELHQKSGTAIGDAIWLGRISFLRGLQNKKMVLIGDGDNTAGVLNTSMAAKQAKRDNIAVYTIGVGSHGAVPYGKDSLGRPYMIERTFSEKDFKAISQTTGGQYFHAKSAEDIRRILSEIFRE